MARFRPLRNPSVPGIHSGKRGYQNRPFLSSLNLMETAGHRQMDGHNPAATWQDHDLVEGFHRPRSHFCISVATVYGRRGYGPSQTRGPQRTNYDPGRPTTMIWHRAPRNPRHVCQYMQAFCGWREKREGAVGCGSSGLWPACIPNTT